VVGRAAALCATALISTGAASAAGTTWDKNAGWLQGQIESCAQRVGGFTCTYFPARALNQLFGIGAFCDAERCLRSHEIAAEIAQDAQWTALGKASDQAVLTQAQEMATGGLPVIAVQAGGDTGLIAIVMPGKPVSLRVFRTFFWRWPRLIFRLLPPASVYGQGLNFLFSDPAKVTLYVQK